MADVDQLLSSVYRQPDDDDLRLVVADALQERNDPRGEFIAMQLAIAKGMASAEVRALALELERANGHEWAKAIPGVTRVEFRRGFPWLVESAAPDDAPAWGTVGVLHVPDRLPPALATLLSTSDALHALESIENLPSEVAQQCSDWRTPRLRAISLRRELERETWMALHAVEGLEELSFAADVDRFDMKWFWSAPLVRRLRRIRLRVLVGDAPLSFWRVSRKLRRAPGVRLRIDTLLGMAFELEDGQPLAVIASSTEALPSLAQRIAAIVKKNSGRERAVLFVGAAPCLPQEMPASLRDVFGA